MANSVKTLPPTFTLTHRFEVRFPKFKILPSKEDRVESSEFMCFGHRWLVELSAGGYKKPGVDIFIAKKSNGKIKIKYEIKVNPGNCVDKKLARAVFGDDHTSRRGVTFFFDPVRRSILIRGLDNETLVINVFMTQLDEKEHPPHQFVPPNPFFAAVCQNFNDEITSDVSFVVGGHEIKEEGKKKAKTTHTKFYAHRHILKGCAPILADLCESYEDKKPVSIIDTKPEIFEQMMQYVYGGTILEEELKSNAKQLIDAADKYGVVGLKLEAEARYVNSTTINIDNVIENLLYAHAKNCALLNEAVVDFIVEHGKEVMAKVSFSDVPGDVLPDLWAAMMREKNECPDWVNGDQMDFSTMRVSALRRMCHEKGLDIDGSRKTLIDLLTNAQENSD